MQTKPAARAGRPSGGINRKEQIRLAVAARRRNLASRSLSVEIPAGLFTAISRVMERDGISQKEAVIRLLETGYLADQAAHGKSTSSLAGYLAESREEMAQGNQQELKKLRRFRAKVRAT
jgi:hypothetical protein